MPAWLTLKVAFYIAATIAAVFALWALYSAITANPKAEARLGRNQTTAAIQSGKDAVQTVGDAAAREAAGADLTRTNEQAIRQAQGADAQVSVEAQAAGLTALCKRKAYKDTPRCRALSSH